MDDIMKNRPDSLTGSTEKIRTGYGNLFLTINVDQAGKPIEIFASIGKSGHSIMAVTEAICRLASLALQSGTGVDTIVEQLIGIGGSSPVVNKNEEILSIPDAIAKILQRHFGSGKKEIT